MSTFVLFGAGASAFSGDCLPTNPPLGNGLFAELVKLGGPLATVEPDLAELFTRDFEAGMAVFRERHETESSDVIRTMARYFAQFRPGLGNLYVRFLTELPLMRRRFVFATPNYELLFEFAANELGYSVTHTINNVQRGYISLLKPHGSCNFLPDIPNSSELRDFKVRFSVPGATGSILDAPVRAATPSEAVEFCDRENVLAPALSLYVRGKRMLFCRSALLQQQAELAVAVAAASRLYVIGVRVNPEDEHIWQPLAAATAPIFYVGPDVAPFQDWASHNRRKQAIHLASSFEDAIPEIARHHARH